MTCRRRAALLVEVFAPDRMRAVDGGYAPTPWRVTCSDHQWRGDWRIPLWREAQWEPPDGPLPYWRGRVVSIRVDE